MDIILILFLILLLIGILILSARLFVWVSKDRKRIRTFCVLLLAGFFAQGINHFFFNNMSFIQSEVYPDLFLVKHPEKERSAILRQAIQEKIKQHMNMGFPNGKKLAYQKENSIFFYAYNKAFPFSVFQDEGTAYFIKHEEDLGGFVTEELGMYSRYKLAEFHYFPCNDNVTQYCGELEYFDENGVITSERLYNLAPAIKTSKDVDVRLDADPLQTAFAVKNEKQFLEEFPASFEQFQNIFGWDEHTQKPKKLSNESYAYIDYFFDLISREEYKPYEAKVIDIAKNGTWQAGAANHFQDKIIQYIKEKQQHSFIDTLGFKEARAVLFFIFDGPHPQFDQVFAHALNNEKMHILYDLFANEFALKQGDLIDEAASNKLSDNILISSVIRALDIAPPTIKTNLIAIKTNPQNTNEAIVIIPEIADEGEQYFDLNSHIILANYQTGEITHKFFESSKTNKWVSDAIELKEINIDTAPYRMDEDVRAFGVRVRYSGMSRVNPYTGETLSLFIKSDTELKKVLNAYPVLEAVGQWDGNCSGEFKDTESTLLMSGQTSNGFFDIKIRSRITTTINKVNTNGECDALETEAFDVKKLKFDGAEYKLLH